MKKVFFVLNLLIFIGNGALEAGRSRALSVERSCYVPFQGEIARNVFSSESDSDYSENDGDESESDSEYSSVSQGRPMSVILPEDAYFYDEGSGSLYLYAAKIQHFFDILSALVNQLFREAQSIHIMLATQEQYNAMLEQKAQLQNSSGSEGKSSNEGGNRTLSPIYYAPGDPQWPEKSRRTTSSYDDEEEDPLDNPANDPIRAK